ncbi:MAG: hypothetical protein OXU36_10600 [Candidatus Poribacteria bacterium]|nr:hypothetical protein [Candidatus Poribacteria bacterium]
MTIPAGVVEFVTITEVGLFVESEGGIMVAAASVNLLRQSGESTTINYRLDLHAREITP